MQYGKIGRWVDFLASRTPPHRARTADFISVNDGRDRLVMVPAYGSPRLLPPHFRFFLKKNLRTTAEMTDAAFFDACRPKSVITTWVLASDVAFSRPT